MRGWVGRVERGERGEVRFERSLGTGWARSRLRRLGARRHRRPGEQVPRRQRRLAPAPGGAFLASPDWEARLSAGQEILGSGPMLV